MVQRLDEGMQSLAEVIKKTTGKDITNYPGAGAARGMGGGLLAFFNAELKPGTELLLKAIDFSEKIKGADLIITGEGKADRQTAMGKVPYRILKEAQKEHIPVIVLAGSIENLPELNKAGFKGIFLQCFRAFRFGVRYTCSQKEPLYMFAVCSAYSY